MVGFIVDRILQQFQVKGWLEKETDEYYRYALIVMIERWMTVSTILLISIVNKKIVCTIIFLMCFLGLRSRTGGFHADRFWKCYCGTTAIYYVIDKISSFCVENMHYMDILTVIACILIAMIGTVNHPNIAMNYDEFNASKKRARKILLLEIVNVIAAANIFHNDMYIFYMEISIILCALLLCLSKIIKQEVSNEKSF